MVAAPKPEEPRNGEKSGDDEVAAYTGRRGVQLAVAARGVPKRRNGGVHAVRARPMVLKLPGFRSVSVRAAGGAVELSEPLRSHLRLRR